MGAIQVLRNATGVGVYGSGQISITKVHHGPSLLVLGVVHNCQHFPIRTESTNY